MYTDGQIINKQEHIAFANWNNTNGNKFRSESLGNGTYKIVEIVIPEPTVEEKQAQSRAIRNSLLDDSDKYLMPDFPTDDAGRELYIQYRQYLRDYTKQNNWWESLPDGFADWRANIEKVDEILKESTKPDAEEAEPEK